MKGVASGTSHLTSLGEIDVSSNAAEADAFLAQHILTLDPTAIVHATPALHIATNDVRASHAATVTNVSREDLFYMVSRGIAESDARALAIAGFLGELLMRIPTIEAREAVERTCMRSGVPLGKTLEH